MERKIAVKSDWDTEDMPFSKAKFKLKRHFTEEEIRILKRGHIPQEQEDKWFWYCENDTLYAHRSWTGFCIYVIQLDFVSDIHRVTVNRNKKQYANRNKKEDLRQLQSLLNWWVQPCYDYYGEWVTETADALQQADNHKRKR